MKNLFLKSCLCGSPETSLMTLPLSGHIFPWNDHQKFTISNGTHDGFLHPLRLKDRELERLRKAKTDAKHPWSHFLLLSPKFWPQSKLFYWWLFPFLLDFWLISQFLLLNSDLFLKATHFCSNFEWDSSPFRPKDSPKNRPKTGQK